MIEFLYLHSIMRGLITLPLISISGQFVVCIPDRIAGPFPYELKMSHVDQRPGERHLLFSSVSDVSDVGDALLCPQRGVKGMVGLQRRT